MLAQAFQHWARIRLGQRRRNTGDRGIPDEDAPVSRASDDSANIENIEDDDATLVGSETEEDQEPPSFWDNLARGSDATGAHRLTRSPPYTLSMPSLSAPAVSTPPVSNAGMTGLSGGRPTHSPPSSVAFLASEEAAAPDQQHTGRSESCITSKPDWAESQLRTDLLSPKFQAAMCEMLVVSRTVQLQPSGRRVGCSHPTILEESNPPCHLHKTAEESVSPTTPGTGRLWTSPLAIPLQSGTSRVPYKPAEPLVC